MRRPHEGVIRNWVMLSLLVAFSVVFSIAFPPSPGLAMPPTTEYRGPAIVPAENIDIRLEEETVQVVCYRSFAECRVDLRFVNSGPAQSLCLGFPAPYPFEPVGFHAWQDDRSMGRLEVLSTDSMPGSPDVLLLQVQLPPGETMVAVEYLTQPKVMEGPRFADATPKEFAALGIPGRGEYYKYSLSKGAAWKGTIGKAVIRFHLADNFAGWAVDASAGEGPEDGALVTSPGSYEKLDNRTYQWVFQDLEPTSADDIVFAYTAPVLPSPSATIATLRATSASDSEETRLAFDGNPDTAWTWPAGEEAWLESDIHGDQQMKEISILSGANGSSVGEYARYGRPKSVRVEYSDGTNEVILLEDTPRLQTFVISGEAEWVRLQVLEVYPGTDPSNLASMSEIGLSTGYSPSDEIVFARTAHAFPAAYGTVATLRAASDPTTSDMPGSAVNGILTRGWTWTSGQDAWLELGIEGDHHLGEVRILPGDFAIGDVSFYRAGRPKSIKVDLSDGTSTVIALEDEPTLQRFAISGEAEWARFRVLDTYSAGYDSDRVTISEIDLGAKATPAFRPFSELILEAGGDTRRSADSSKPSPSPGLEQVLLAENTSSGIPAPLVLRPYQPRVDPGPELDTGTPLNVWALSGIVAVLALFGIVKSLLYWRRSR